MDDQVVRTVSRIVIPFAVVYGSYIMIHGHLSPGGGFPGGALLGAALVLYTLIYGVGRGARKMNRHVSERLEAGSVLSYVAVGTVGIVAGGEFLTNLDSGIAAGEFGAVVSAGFIPVIGVIIGVKVAATLVKMFHRMVDVDSRDL